MAKRSSLKKVAAFAAVAGAIGYLTGVLTAPRSGAKTRSILRKKGAAEIEEVEEKLKLLYSELSELLAAANGEDKGLDSRGQKRFSAALAAAKDSKDKRAKVIDAIKEGGSQDKDLDRAVTEAENAIKHAKTFLLKK